MKNKISNQKLNQQLRKVFGYTEEQLIDEYDRTSETLKEEKGRPEELEASKTPQK